MTGINKTPAPWRAFWASLCLTLGLALLTPAMAQTTDDDAAMRSMTESVLSGLGVKTKKKKPKPKPVDETAADPAMRSMTDSVLAGLGGARTAPEPEDEELAVLIGRALSEGRSDDYLKTLLDEAVETGELTVPDDLRAGKKGLDTDALISVLRSEAELTDGGKKTDEIMLTGIKAARFPFVDMDLRISGGKHFYRIKPDDSLTGIALRAYGDAAFFKRIFESNSDRLASPNLIQVGQRLYIPDVR